MYMRTVVVASERDFWSRPRDRQDLVADLVQAPLLYSGVIPNATHFVHVDRPNMAALISSTMCRRFC